MYFDTNCFGVSLEVLGASCFEGMLLSALIGESSTWDLSLDDAKL